MFLCSTIELTTLLKCEKSGHEHTNHKGDLHSSHTLPESPHSGFLFLVTEDYLEHIKYTINPGFVKHHIHQIHGGVQG